VPDEGDFMPVPLGYGEVFVFDGAGLTHGNRRNETGKTRVSFDFRVVSPSLYTPGEGGSINTGTKFVVGDDDSAYFSRLP
jgi:ectoine hydroxylase-related dioxygenase (phytanoyl-CoA dioxygenase family)